MKTEVAIARSILAYQDAWFSYFPGLSRRAEWHVIFHLCLKGPNGCAAGELYGLIKQIFLMDDATVKERLLTIRQMGLCELHPSGQIFSRTVVRPTPDLMTLFDAHLIEFGTKIAVIPISGPYEVPQVLSHVLRTQLVRALHLYTDHWSNAIDAIFDLGDLSPARRSDAKRHLISSSHWNLVHQALVWQLEGGSRVINILADHLAARLLELTGHSLQTTKDHISYLINIGIFRRMKGKVLNVSLTDHALQQLHQALARTADDLPGVLGVMASIQLAPLSSVATDRTLKCRAAPERKPTLRSILEIVDPASHRRTIEVEAILVVGRAPPSDVLLNSQDVSRTHCRINFNGRQLTVTDLNSTNGTFVNEAAISAATVVTVGDQIRVGSYIINYQGNTFATSATLCR